MTPLIDPAIIDEPMEGVGRPLRGNPLSSASPMEPASAVSTKGFDQAPGESARHFIIMDALGLLPPTLARTAQGEGL